MLELPFVDLRDLFYLLTGLAFLGLSLQPALSRLALFNLPAIYVAIGAGSVLIGLPVIDPLAGDLAAKVVEHGAELIVIISLAGTGLAIDTPESWRNWQPTWRLLIIAMPLGIVLLTILGTEVLGLSLSSAVLLAAALAPTDPVLARSVQVGPPGHDEEPTRIALTAEAGLNDGLAFPFIWLAITLAGLSAAPSDDWGWLWSWFSFDLVYRVAVGVVVGLVCGRAMSKLVYSRFGDATYNARNPTLTVLAGTVLAYGAAEALNAYGFLAVFMSARAARARSRGQDTQSYEREVHHGAEQLESILLALLLLWLGTFIASGLWREWTWLDVAYAVLLIGVVRPVTAWLALAGIKCLRTERWMIAFFGIRGMGSIFYIAYAQNHAEFTNVEAVWRIAALTILLSIVVHEFAAKVALPDREHDEGESP